MFAARKAETEGAGEEAQEDASDVIDIDQKPEITYEDFEKLQFQVGEIIACEEVKKSKKLLCSQVRVGSQVKQIVSGIKAHYSAAVSYTHLFTSLPQSGHLPSTSWDSVQKDSQGVQ